MVRETWKNEAGHVYAIGRYYDDTDAALTHWNERVADGREPDPRDAPEYEPV